MTVTLSEHLIVFAFKTEHLISYILAWHLMEVEVKSPFDNITYWNFKFWRCFETILHNFYIVSRCVSNQKNVSLIINISPLISLLYKKMKYNWNFIQWRWHLWQAQFIWVIFIRFGLSIYYIPIDVCSDADRVPKLVSWSVEICSLNPASNLFPTFW